VLLETIDNIKNMIKTAGNIILALLVLCTTTGLVVNKHYSEGELYSMAFYGEAESCCGNEDHHMNSCHDETRVYKVKDYFRASQNISIQGFYKSIIQPASFSELFDITRPVTILSSHHKKILIPRIPLPETLQVFIL
jgi:hypothetical protein